MAAASLVATAFGIIIILVTAYVLAGSTLATTEVVTTAQKDMTELQVKMLGTSIQYVNSSIASDGIVYIEIENTGREPINGYNYMDVYLLSSERGPILYRYKSNSDEGWWDYSPPLGRINPSQWDPGEIINITVKYFGITPVSFKVVTPNGISAWHEIGTSPF